MADNRDYRERKNNQIRALVFLLAVTVCFAVGIVLTVWSGSLKKSDGLDGQTVPGQAAGARTDPEGLAAYGGEETVSSVWTEAEDAAETPVWTEAGTGAEELSEDGQDTSEQADPVEMETAGDAAASEDTADFLRTGTALWDLDALPNDLIPYGYVRENRNEANVPTDMFWYESQWGQYNVDWIQDTQQNVIYLTMDDGFPNETTAVILDILKEKDVKAVFFLTKQFVDGMPEIVQRMIDEGHQIGNHTCNHPTMPDISVEEQTAEIMDLQDQLREQFGYEMKYFRFPEGAFSERSLGLVDNLGMKTVFWSYAYNDYSEEQPPVEESFQLAVSELHPGAIYLLHANSSTNAAFLADWIDTCRSMGFEFGEYPDTAN